MSFLTYLDLALKRLAEHPASAQSAEITRSALRMKALYAELDARASRGDRHLDEADGHLSSGDRLPGSESGFDSTFNGRGALHRVVEGGSARLDGSEAASGHPAVEARLGEAGGRQATAPGVEVVKSGNDRNNS